MIFKNLNKRKKNMLSSLKTTLELYGAKLISFKYYYKVFGNIVIEYQYKNDKNILVSDRGEIRHNHEVVFKQSIKPNGRYDPFYFVIRAIEEELSNKIDKTG